MRQWFIKYYGVLGLVLSLGSFLHWLFPQDLFNEWTLFVIHAVFVVGLIMFFDWICLRLEGKSFLNSIKTKKDLIFAIKNFLIIGIVFGVILEIYAHWIGKFWFYTYWGWGWYLIMFIPGFAGYVFFFLESYLGVKAILSILRKREIIFSPGPGVNKWIATASGVIVFLLSVYIMLIQQYRNINDFFSIDFAPVRQSNLLFLIIIAGCLVMIIIDFLLSKARGFSFTSTILKLNFWPIISLLIAGWFLGFVWEFFNAKAYYWTYANSIWPDLNMFGFPVSVFLLWPVQYIPIIALYYVLFKREK